MRLFWHSFDILVAIVLLMGCATRGPGPDVITLPRAQVAYSLGGLQVRLGDACTAGRLDAKTCGEITAVAEYLRKEVLAPPVQTAPAMDVDAFMRLIMTLGKLAVVP